MLGGVQRTGQVRRGDAGGPGGALRHRPPHGGGRQDALGHVQLLLRDHLHARQGQSGVADDLAGDLHRTEGPADSAVPLAGLALGDDAHAGALTCPGPVSDRRLLDDERRLVVERGDDVAAPLMDVDGADVHGGVRGGAVDRADHRARDGVDHRHLRRPVPAQGGQVLGPTRQARVPEPAGGAAAQRSAGGQVRQEGLVGQSEQRQIRLAQGRLAGSRAQVRGQHVGVGGVEDGGLRGGEDRLRVVDQVGVQRVVAGDQDGDAAGAGPPGAARLLAQAHARARPAGDDDGVQAGDVDAELEGAGRRQGAEPPAAQVPLQGPALLGQVAAPVGGHRAHELGQTHPQGAPGALGHDLGAAARAHEDERPRSRAQQVHEQLGGLDDRGAAGRGVLGGVERVGADGNGPRGRRPGSPGRRGGGPRRETA